jgi:hypothetical protein
MEDDAVVMVGMVASIRVRRIRLGGKETTSEARS